MDAAIQGLTNILHWHTVFLCVISMFVAMIIGILPGLGGLACLSLLMPFIYTMDAPTALAFLVSVSGACDAGGYITSILVNVPGNPDSVATCWDGFPMTRRGEAQRAIGIASMASFMGGLFGVMILLAMIPVMRPLVLAFTPAEYFALVMVGILFIAGLVGKDITKGLIAGGFGLGLSFMGSDPMTGVPRFTFGTLYLWNGIDFGVLVIGIYAFAEMINMAVEGNPIATVEDAKGKGSQWLGQLQGVLDVIRRWKTLLQCSLMGTIIGLIPGLGASVANVATYGYAAKTSKHPELFGTGIPEGIIASECANNARWGGSIVPTLAFGIPGSSGMAFLLGAFLVFGIVPGKEMLTTRLDITFTLIWTYILTTGISCLAAMVFAGPFARIALIPAKIIVPVVIVIGLAGAYSVESRFSDVIIAGVFGIIGYYMLKHNYSRPVFIIGFVMGKLAERSFHLAKQMFGSDFVLRPFTLSILVLGFGLTLIPILRQARKNRSKGGLAA
jgi:putative tricarboxylic transport membrane protein